MKTRYYLLIFLLVCENLFGQNPEPGKKDSMAYRPYKHAFSFQVLPGINSDGGYFDGKLQICYGTPKVRYGLGIGVVNYDVKVNKRVFLLVGWSALESKEFMLSFMPIYAHLSVNLSRKRIAPFMSFDMGVSVPVTQSAKADATFEANILGYGEGSQGKLTIEKINTGFYFGFSTGVRGYFLPNLEGGISFGFDSNSNYFTGTYFYHGTEPGVINQYNYHGTHFSGGFCLNLMFAFHLPVGRQF